MCYKEGMRAYSIDIRERVLKLCDEGKMTNREIAERFKVGEWWIYKLKRQRRVKGIITPLKGNVGKPCTIRESMVGKLVDYVEAHPDATLEQIHKHLKVTCSLPTIHNTLKRLGYRYKKNATRQRARST